MQREATADVVIIGAGLAGLLLAATTLEAPAGIVDVSAYTGRAALERLGGGIGAG